MFVKPGELSSSIQHFEKISRINLDMMNPNKILGVREKDSRTFYKMDLALEKNENNYQNNLENSQ